MIYCFVLISHVSFHDYTQITFLKLQREIPNRTDIHPSPSNQKVLFDVSLGVGDREPVTPNEKLGVEDLREERIPGHVIAEAVWHPGLAGLQVWGITPPYLCTQGKKVCREGWGSTNLCWFVPYLKRCLLGAGVRDILGKWFYGFCCYDV